MPFSRRRPWRSRSADILVGRRSSPVSIEMKSLLLVAHGSRRRESNEEIGRLAARVAERAGDRFDIVEHAFLELAEPSIGEGIERCVARGAAEVAVVPYFLARGTHVAEDVPAEVEPKRAEHPGIDIRITDYLGTSGALPELLLGLVVRGDDAADAA